MTEDAVSPGQTSGGLTLQTGGTVVHRGGAQSLVHGAMVFASVLSGGAPDNDGTASDTGFNPGPEDFALSGGFELGATMRAAGDEPIASDGIAGGTLVGGGVHLLGSSDNTAFVRSSDGAGGTRVLADAACYVVGTHILTTEGEVRIEHLRPGQLLVLEDGGTAPMLWLGELAIDCTRHRAPEKVWPVRIRRDAVAPGVPHRDLVLSPEHAVYYDGTFIPVRMLINGATVVQEKRVWVHYLHVELERHSVVLAEGMAAESWLDRGNRGMFGNAPDGSAVIDDFESSTIGDVAYAPRAETGLVVQALKEVLLNRAHLMGFVRCSEPDLHLLLDGRRYEVEDAVLRPGLREVLIVCRTGVPTQQTAQSTDTRQLGVMLSSIVLRDPFETRCIQMNHPALDRGFASPENGNGKIVRWTTGAASLCPMLWAGMTGPVHLELEIQSVYPVWVEPEDLELAGG